MGTGYQSNKFERADMKQAGVKDSYFALDKDKSNGKLIRQMQPLEATRQDVSEHLAMHWIEIMTDPMLVPRGFPSFRA